MIYYGSNFLADLRKQVSQYTTEFVSVGWGNYLAKQALFELIEKNYHSIYTQARKDEINSLIVTGKTFPVVDNKTPLKPVYFPDFSITVVGPNSYQVTFPFPHNLSSTNPQPVTFTNIEVATNLNDTFTFGTIPLPGEYFVVSPTVINIRCSTAAIPGATGGLFYEANYIYDYYHLLAVKTKFSELTKFTLSMATYTSPIVITVKEPNNLRSGELIEIAGVTGLTSANGQFYVKKLKSKTFALYLDEKLTTPSVPTPATYVSGGTISRIVKEWAKPYNSDQKIEFYKPNIYRPYVETAEWYLKYYPQNEVCSEIEIDYIKLAAKIDCADSTLVNLYNLYNQTFLNNLVVYAAKMFFTIVQSPQDYQLINSNITQNNAVS